MLSIDATPDVKYNSARAMSKLQPYLVAALEAATDELLKQMQILVHTVTDVGATGKGAPGDPEWRNEIDRELKKLYVEVTKNAIEGAVGVSYSSGYRFVRLMLVAYGSGSRSDAPDWTPSPIMYGPEGRSVWNDSLTRHHPSQSKRTGQMPDGFNQAGNHFIQRAMEELQAHFSQVVTKALQNMPATLLQDCFTQ